MNLATMLSRVRKGLDDRASDYADAELIAAMQTIWQYHLPYRVDGQFRNRVIDFVLGAGVPAYNVDFDTGYPGVLLSLERIWFDVSNPGGLQEIAIIEDQYEFLAHPEISPSVLWEDRWLTFNPTPIGGEIVKLKGRCAAFPFDADPGSPNNGIVDDEKAIAVTRGTVLDIATQEGWTDIVQEYAQYYEGSIKTLRGMSYTEPRQMPWRPDF